MFQFYVQQNYKLTSGAEYNTRDPGLLPMYLIDGTSQVMCNCIYVLKIPLLNILSYTEQRAVA